MIKIICAPDKFKESLTSPQAAAAMARGIARVLPEAVVDLCPIADGGDGTVDALLAATGGRAFVSQVQGPLGEPVNARWGILGQHTSSLQMKGNADKGARQALGDVPGGVVAVIEMAAASGMALLPGEMRDPTRTSTYGTGQLIAQAIEHGATTVVLGIGGSATNDGGCGALQALGACFHDHQHGLITQPITGGMLKQIASIDLGHVPEQVERATYIAACDVNNPLAGLQGAAYVYAPQKGATPQQVKELDEGLVHLAQVWKKELGRDVLDTPGAGAAGGLGGGLLAMLDATLRSGATLVLDVVDFAQRARGASLCLTGEGRIDGQSLSGKACLVVAKAAHEAGVRDTIALVGSAADDATATLEHGLKAYHVIGQGLPVKESIARAAELLENRTAEVVSAWARGR